MPNKPQYKARFWKPERVAFGRRVDNSKFYNSRKWRKTSVAYREAHPICRICKVNGNVGHADVCDHIRGLQFLLDNGLDPYNWNELQSLCYKCDRSKSGHDAHKVGG